MKFVLYDLEATCWLGKPPHGIQEIIEIGAVMTDIYGEELSSYSNFVKPIVNPKLSPFCKKLTGIGQEDVQNAKKFPVVFQDFHDWIGVGDEDFIMASWGDGDIRFMRADCDLHKLCATWTDDALDLRHQYAKFKNFAKPVSLKKALHMEGHDFEGQQHRAIVDAQNLVKIFRSHIDAWVF